jgi:hypothetical protein
LGISLGSGLVASELLSTTVVTANQISILPGQSKSINYIWPIVIYRIISISLPQQRHLIIIVSSTIDKNVTASSPASIEEKETSSSTIKNNIIIAQHPPKKNQNKKSKEEEITAKLFAISCSEKKKYYLW